MRFPWATHLRSLSRRQAQLGNGYGAPRCGCADGHTDQRCRTHPNAPVLGTHPYWKGGERERLEALARELGLGPRARFLGPFAEAELPGLYARAAAAVFPARLEGFGIGVLEALRARCPLAVSQIPAHLEVAGSGVPSFSLDDARACVAAIRAALAAKAADDVTERYSWDASARALVEGWAQFLARR